MRIDLILTGGTICSFETDGTRRSNAGAAKTLLESQFYAAHPQTDVQFVTQMPLDRLSEDLTPDDWRTLLAAVASCDLSQTRGILIAHGTDTLEQTAAMLSAALCGIPVPVVLVSAMLPPQHLQTDAHANFAAGAALIAQGLCGGVYAVSCSADGTVYLHSGALLLRCQHGSTEFFSDTMQPVDAVLSAPKSPHTKNTRFVQRALICAREIGMIYPYNGMRYDTLPLSGFAAIVHLTYHSETANARADSPYSVRTLLRRCAEQGIPLYLAPCSEQSQAYGSAHDLVQAGAVPLQMPAALAYGAVWAGAQYGLTGDTLTAFVRENAQALLAQSFRCCM